jgi:hypothetical protein
MKSKMCGATSSPFEAWRIRKVGQVDEAFRYGMNNGHKFLWSNLSGLAITVVST